MPIHNSVFYFSISETQGKSCLESPLSINNKSYPWEICYVIIMLQHQTFVIVYPLTIPEAEVFIASFTKTVYMFLPTLKILIKSGFTASIT